MAKGKYADWLTDDGLLLLTAWARDGLTDVQIAKNMGVSLTTLKSYKRDYQPISTALKKGKEVVDIEVENALCRRATGYTVTVKKHIKVKTVLVKNGMRKETEEVVPVDDEIYVPPDTTAQIYWLKNRKPKVWRDKPDNDAGAEPVKIILVRD